MSNITSEKVGFSEFERWLNGRNRWLQTAAKQLIDNKRLLNEGELAELVRLCKLEAANQNDIGFSMVGSGAFLEGVVQRVVRVEKVTEVLGVNAIKPGAFLSFGTESLTIIHGQNGTGKSGFSRLLKQICGSRSQDEIHPNVFSDEEQACSAKCQVTVDDNSIDINWHSAARPHAMLKYAQIFDSKVATQYMERTESSYEPSSMRFISRLIEISDKVSGELRREKENLVSTLPQFPSDLSETAEKIWFSSLNASTSEEDVEAYCHYEKDLNDERVKAEALLSEKDVAGRLTALGKQSDAIESIKHAMKLLKEGLADEKGAALSKAKASAVEARNAANQLARQTFAKAPLQGIGETSWKLMWEQACAYSVAHAYQGHEFPVTANGAHCVLCQQELTAEGANRLKSFKDFVTAGLETAAKKAEDECNRLIMKVVEIPSIESWIAHLAQLQFDETTARAWYWLLTSRRAQFVECAAVKDIPVFDWAPIDQILDRRTADLLAIRSNLVKLQQDGQRQLVENRVKQLKALQWLSQNKQAIVVEQKRLAAVELLDKAISLTATNSLTFKRTELGRTELDAGYQTRFNSELKLLGGGRLPVMLQSKAQGKGVIKFGLALRGARNGASPKIVLSEGETRIVALAAFLADTTGSNQLAPFIFDDPISSLDQDFEEKVVGRLVELAKTRQVIIFTHRLSLVALVQSAIKKHIENPVSCVVKSLRRMGKYTGVLSEQSIIDMKPKKALNFIKNESIPKLRKYQAEADVENYDLHMKNNCSNFRIILERTVEYTLLHDVVARFRRDIMTKGKLRGVANVTTKDCEFIDRLMTKYSVYEHAQADELPQVPPELDGFEQDLSGLIEWINEFESRAS